MNQNESTMISVSEPKILSGVELESERKFQTGEFSFVMVSLNWN